MSVRQGTLKCLIEEYLAPLTVAWKDLFSAYNDYSLNGYDQLTLNYSENSLGPNSGVLTHKVGNVRIDSKIFPMPSGVIEKPTNSSE